MLPSTPANGRKLESDCYGPMTVLLQLRELGHAEQHEEILATNARTATEIWGAGRFQPVTALPLPKAERRRR